VIPHARLENVPGAAHGLMIEHAVAFNRSVLAFLTGLPR
jgi:pimeloyl-ACP methyl ester carboxylesterase